MCIRDSLLSTINGMFIQDYIDVTDFVKIGESNGLAIKIYPVDPSYRAIRIPDMPLLIFRIYHFSDEKA